MAGTSTAPSAPVDRSIARAGSPAPLFGRAEVFEEILRTLHSARDGAGRMIVLNAGVGLGKSTLLRSALAAARDLGFQVLGSRALPVDVPEPFSLLQGLLREARLHGGDQPTTPAVGAALPLFLVPAEVRRPPMAGVAADQEPLSKEGEQADRLINFLANPRERLDASQSTIIAQLTDFFLQLSEAAPLLLALDDLQFADPSSLEFLQLFAPTLDRTRVSIIATATPPADLPSGSRDAIHQLLTQANVEGMRIRPMTESELGEFVRWMMHGRDPGRDAIMRWFSQTEGNPLFVEHLVRRNLAPGAVPEPTGIATQGFDDVLKERIQALGDAERRALVYAAALGKEFEFDTLAKGIGSEEERLSESVDRLVQAGILREKGGEVYEFVSERARSDIYGQLTETRRRILHRNAARAIEARGATGSSVIYELARQYYLGRDDAKAVEYNRRAAELAAEAHAFETAIVFLERALECARRLHPRDVPTELRILIELGRHLDEMGDLKRSEELLVDAVHRARAESGRETDLALALLGLAQTRGDLSQYAASRALATEAYAILAGLGHKRGLSAAHRVLGVAAWRLGNLADAEYHQREGIAFADADGSLSERGHSRIDLANSLIVQGEAKEVEALRLYDEAAEFFSQSLDFGARARVLMNRSLLHHNAGRMTEALADLVQALAAAEKSHSRIWIGYCELNMAQYRAELHEPDEASRHLARALELLESQGDQLFRQQATMIRGMIAQEKALGPLAEELYREALRLAVELGLGAEVAEMHFRLAGLALVRGHPADARRHLDEARKSGIETVHADLLHQVQDLERRIGSSAGSPQT